MVSITIRQHWTTIQQQWTTKKLTILNNKEINNIEQQGNQQHWTTTKPTTLNNAYCWRTGHGDPVLLSLAWQTIVGRWPPRPVLQQEAGVFTPLSNGEGTGVGLFIWLLEDGARRPPSYYDLQGYLLPSPTGRGRGWGFCIFMQYCKCFLIPLKLHSESLGFRLWNQGF